MRRVQPHFDAERRACLMAGLALAVGPIAAAEGGAIEGSWLATVGPDDNRARIGLEVLRASDATLESFFTIDQLNFYRVPLPPLEAAGPGRWTIKRYEIEMALSGETLSVSGLIDDPVDMRRVAALPQRPPAPPAAPVREVAWRVGLGGPLYAPVAVHGRAKQGAAFGYAKVRGYHPQLATCAQTGQVLMSRLRGGSAGAARGAASFLTETISRVRAARATGQLTVRADSAFYSKTVLSTAAKFDVRFSVTARQDKRVRAAIEAIPEEAWQPIPYWLSTPEVSGADVAETAYTCFAGDKRHARTVRLVVRRVRPTPGSQLALFTTWDFHAFVTDRDGDVLELEADHRRHAVVEQRIAELKSAGLAHLPSGNFMANAAWLALAVMAHNLGRALGRLAGPDLAAATAATLRRKVFTMPGRLVHSGRRRRLRLPQRWPWAAAITTALDKIIQIPMRC